MSDRALFWQRLPNGLRHCAQRWPKCSAIGLGIVSALGFQPIGLWPLAMLAMGGFALVLAGSRTIRRAALLGWLFGLGHFTIGSIWMASPFAFQTEMPAFLGWFAVPIVGAYLGVFPALAMAASWRLAGKSSASHSDPKPNVWALTLAMAGCWMLAEYLRATVFTGYAWNPFSVILLGTYDRPGLAILAPFLGTYALSGVAVGLSCGLVLLAWQRRWLGFLLLSAAVISGMFWPAGAGREGSLSVTIAQPDIRQENLHDPFSYESNYQRLAQLSAPQNIGETRLVLWPESGMVDYLEEGYPQRYYERTTTLASPIFARRRIGQDIGKSSLLLTGAIDLEFEQDLAVGAYNSVTALSGDGEIIGSYSKTHLVPFGEYLPFRDAAEAVGLSRFVPGSFDFLSGGKPSTVDLGAYGKAGIQICYEIIFSGEVTQDGARPDYIFNPSNDGWFGYFGPPQHLAQARLRAVEEGLPVLRSTTTGISAIIDARGVVREFLPWQEMGRIDAKVPPAHAPTLFARLGNILVFICAFLCLAGLVVVRRLTGR